MPVVGRNGILGGRTTYLVGGVAASSPADGYNGAAPASVTIPVPAGAVVGDLLVAFLSTSVVATSANLPAGWTEQVQLNNGGVAKAWVITRFMQSGDTGVTFTSPNEAYSGCMVAVRGADRANPVSQVISAAPTLSVPSFAASRGESIALLCATMMLGNPLAGQACSAFGGPTMLVGHWMYAAGGIAGEFGHGVAHERLYDLAAKTGRYFTQTPAGAHCITGVVVQP